MRARFNVKVFWDIYCNNWVRNELEFLIGVLMFINVFLIIYCHLDMAISVVASYVVGATPS